MTARLVGRSYYNSSRGGVQAYGCAFARLRVRVCACARARARVQGRRAHLCLEERRSRDEHAHDDAGDAIPLHLRIASHAKYAYARECAWPCSCLCVVLTAVCVR